MGSGRSLALRSIAALALMAVFFAGALVAAVLFVWLGVETLLLIGEAHGRGLGVILVFASGCIAAAAVILWSIVPRIDRFEPPGPELREKDGPALFAEIRRISSATGQAPPAHVYLAADVNAFVTQRGGVMGIGSKRVMGVGLPLLEILSVGELRGVIAHEFGHFHGGDTKLGPWIYKTRAAVGRTVANLQRAEAATQEIHALLALVMRIARAPFGWFATRFMRITQAISRAQERSADALAARVVGSTAVVEGLKKVHAGASAYGRYFAAEVVPLLEAGYRPPLAEGYRRFAGLETIASEMARAVENELREGENDEFDSHPPLRERVAAVEALAVPLRLGDDRRAIELAHDVAALEAKLAVHMVVESHTLTAISWEESAARVFAPNWRKRVDKDRKSLVGLIAGKLPRAPSVLRGIAERNAGSSLGSVSDQEIARWATGLFGTALATALLDRGWTASNLPGAPIQLHRGGAKCQPFNEVRDYLAGETEQDTWRARVDELGLADVDLGQPPAADP